MTTYTYVALDKRGNKKQSTIDANSIDEARQLVALTGKTIIEIREPSALSKLKVPKKVIPKDLSIFCQQMTSMLKAGVTVVDALNMVSMSTSNPTLKEALISVSASVAKGDSLATAMSEYKDVFPFILVKMIEAGELSGSIDATFDRMGIQFEKSQKTKDTIKKALNYPKLLLGVCFGAVGVVSTVVLPNFVGIFEEMGTELPLPTKILMGLSDFVMGNWYIILIVLAAVIISWKLFSNSDKGKDMISRVKLKIPAFRNLEEKTATANMARLLCTLLGSGMYMAQALEIVEGTMENVVYKEALGNIRRDVLNGMSLYEATEDTGIFPQLFLNLISIGEKTGEISGMLEKSANYFEDEVDLATQQLSAMLQPAMIMIMGGMVGLLVYAIYGPMMGIYDGLE